MCANYEVRRAEDGHYRRLFVDKLLPLGIVFAVKVGNQCDKMPQRHTPYNGSHEPSNHS